MKVKIYLMIALVFLIFTSVGFAEDCRNFRNVDWGNSYTIPVQIENNRYLGESGEATGRFDSMKVSCAELMSRLNNNPFHGRNVVTYYPDMASYKGCGTIKRGVTNYASAPVNKGYLYYIDCQQGNPSTCSINYMDTIYKTMDGQGLGKYSQSENGRICPEGHQCVDVRYVDGKREIRCDTSCSINNAIATNYFSGENRMVTTIHVFPPSSPDGFVIPNNGYLFHPDDLPRR
ncbi:MAG: hypothetical protein V1870_00010 [Candidatus Aenigmatarchaeota archaeon]